MDQAILIHVPSAQGHKVGCNTIFRSDDVEWPKKGPSLLVESRCGPKRPLFSSDAPQEETSTAADITVYLMSSCANASSLPIDMHVRVVRCRSVVSSSSVSSPRDRRAAVLGRWNSARPGSVEAGHAAGSMPFDCVTDQMWVFSRTRPFFYAGCQWPPYPCGAC